MSMIYDPKKGWTEMIEPTKLVKENFDKLHLETKSNINEIEKHLKNIRGYINYCINEYQQNPNDKESIDRIKGLTEYLRKTIGPGMVGEWSHNA